MPRDNNSVSIAINELPNVLVMSLPSSENNLISLSVSSFLLNLKYTSLTIGFGKTKIPFSLLVVVFNDVITGGQIVSITPRAPDIIPLLLLPLESTVTRTFELSLKFQTLMVLRVACTSVQGGVKFTE